MPYSSQWDAEEKAWKMKQVLPLSLSSLCCLFVSVDLFPSLLLLIHYIPNRAHIAQVIPKFMEICRTSGELL